MTLESFVPSGDGWVFFSQVRALLLYTLQMDQEETTRNYLIKVAVQLVLINCPEGNCELLQETQGGDLLIKHHV